MRRNPSKRAPALLLVALAVLAAVLTARLSNLTSRSGSTYCTTLNCQAFAQLLRRSINASVAPCDSFSRFMYSVREQHYRNALDSMARLNRGVKLPHEGQRAVQLVATFHRSGDQLYESGRDDTPLVRKALAEAGVTWPSHPAIPSVVHTLVALALPLAGASVLDIEVKTTGAGDSIRYISIPHYISKTGRFLV